MNQDGYRRCLLLIGIVAAWVFQDLAALGVSAEPERWLEILPECLVAIAIAGVLGLLWTRQPSASWLALGAAVVASVLIRWADVAPARVFFARALVLIFAAAVLGDWLTRRRSLPALQIGLGLGGFASFLLAAYLGALDTLAWVVLAASGCLVASAFAPSATARRLINLAVAVSLALLAGAAVSRQLAFPRPDQPPGAAAPSATGPNLILIVLDTLRADRLSSYGYELPTTPKLDALLGGLATRYTDSRAVSSWTLPSHASLLTGLAPRDHGAVSLKRYELPLPQPLRKDVPTLGERLQERGYRTAAIVGNSAMLYHEFGIDRGFERYDDRPGAYVTPRAALVQLAGAKPHVGHRAYRDAEKITDLAFDWIDQRDSEHPFFLFLNYMEVHRPFLPQPPFDRAFGGPTPLDPLNPGRDMVPLLYDRELAFLDEHLSRFLRGLEERGLMDDTVFVITSDHGEAFGEHGFWHHQKTLYDEEIKVPLFVKQLGQRRGAVSEQPMTGMDVHDLMLEALSVPTGTDGAEPVHELYAYGRQVGEEEPRELDMLAWMEGPLKFVVYSDGKTEVFDLDEDPAELRDLADPQLTARARERANAWWAARDSSGEEAVGVSEETLERMRSLGYLR